MSDVRPMLLVLMGAVGFVLLVSILNVANLALARATMSRRLLVEEGRPMEIVGVVGHVNNYGLGEPEFTGNQIYFPWRQVSPKVFVATNSSIQITLRAAAGVAPESLVPEVSRTVATLDPDQPVHAVRTMRTLVETSLGGRRFAMTLPPCSGRSHSCWRRSGSTRW